MFLATNFIQITLWVFKNCDNTFNLRNLKLGKVVSFW